MNNVNNIYARWTIVFLWVRSNLEKDVLQSHCKIYEAWGEVKESAIVVEVCVNYRFGLIHSKIDNSGSVNNVAIKFLHKCM